MKMHLKVNKSMHNKEILYFTDALRLIKQEFYLDAIHKLEMLVDEFPKSDLADDAYYNIGMSYFHINQPKDAIRAFESVIANYPDAIITDLESDKEFGKTAAKAYYGMLNCHLASDNLEEAEKIVHLLKSYNENSYVVIEGKKTTYENLANQSILKYKELS